jgi:predicted SprT family Zn-dependent metalloprotease
LSLEFEKGENMAEVRDDYDFPRRLVYYGQSIRDNSIYVCPYCAKEYTKIELYDNCLSKGDRFMCFSCNKLLVAP